MLTYLYQQDGKKDETEHWDIRKTDEPQQCFAPVKVGGDYGEVIFPIDSEAEIESRRDELTERALEFHRKGLFIREITSPDFLLKIAYDLARKCKTGFRPNWVHLSRTVRVV